MKAKYTIRIDVSGFPQGDVDGIGRAMQEAALDAANGWNAATLATRGKITASTSDRIDIDPAKGGAS